MELRKKPYYLGIDLNDKTAMISFYKQNMKEPETVSTIAGSEHFQVPVLLAKRKGLGQWYYGDEAKKMAKSCEMICVDNLFRRAVNQEMIRIEDQTHSAVDLLTLFFRKMIELSEKLENPGNCSKLVVTVERLTRENMDVLWQVSEKLGLSREQFMVIDHKESFYYFALSQADDLFVHDVYLFEGSDSDVHYFELKRNIHTTPQVVTINESNRFRLIEQKDTDFLQVLQKAFENRIISSVYLVGDIFDGGWMNQSLTYLCRGRRAFLGKNLFSKGACYAAMACAKESDWKYIYIGENEMKFNLSLKVRNHGEVAFYTLISAGKNWFETKGECEVILSGNAEIDFWKQLPNSREAKIETLELTDIPKRPDKTTRLRILANPIADDKIEIEIKDLGFGELFRGTDKSWKYTMSI